MYHNTINIVGKFESQQRRNDNGILLSGDCISNERNGGNSSHTRPIVFFN